jgi:DNA-binding MurR/RpiR family transcriptional regulator
MVYMLSIKELARRCETSEPTILRFLRKIGFESFQLFKVKLAQELSSTRGEDIYQDITPEDKSQDLVQKVVLSSTNAIGDLKQSLNMDDLERIAGMMQKARRILFIGLGSSGLVAADAFYKFSKLGLPTSVHQDPYSISIIGAHAKPEDLFFAISHTGETKEIVNCLELAHEKGSKTVAITSFLHSRISRFTDVLLSSVTSEVKYLPDATISRLVQLVIVDTLYVSVMLRMLPDSGESLKHSRLAIARNKL